MQRIAVESSQIRSIGYEPNGDQTRGTLEIEFKQGWVYQYRNVPSEVHADLMASDSPGKYFNQNIRNRYEFERVHPKETT